MKTHNGRNKRKLTCWAILKVKDYDLQKDKIQFYLCKKHKSEIAVSMHDKLEQLMVAVLV